MHNSSVEYWFGHIVHRLAKIFGLRYKNWSQIYNYFLAVSLMLAIIKTFDTLFF